MDDLISRQAAIDAIDRLDIPEDMCVFEILSHIELEIGTLPSAQPEQYTKEELKTFLHALSLRLLSLRSAQHWREDEERAKEIEFLAHLYEKVEADMKGKT